MYVPVAMMVAGLQLRPSGSGWGNNTRRCSQRFSSMSALGELNADVLVTLQAIVVVQDPGHVQVLGDTLDKNS